jgi:hypothetical protein
MHFNSFTIEACIVVVVVVVCIWSMPAQENIWECEENA